VVQDVFDIALGHLEPLALKVGGDFTHGQVLELFGTEPGQVGLDALALGGLGTVLTCPKRQVRLPVL
jgi:hypothetical protein